MSRYYRNYHKARQQQKSAEVMAKSYIFLTPLIMLALISPIFWFVVIGIFYQINNSVEKKYAPKKHLLPSTKRTRNFDDKKCEKMRKSLILGSQKWSCFAFFLKKSILRKLVFRLDGSTNSGVQAP